MRILYDAITTIVLALAFTLVLAQDVFCVAMASDEHRPNAGLYAIAAAILTGLLVVALAIYARPARPAGGGAHDEARP